MSAKGSSGALALTLGGLLAVAAVVAGLGVARTPAATSQPTSFELQHGRILSFVGTHESDIALGRKKFHPTGGGYGGDYKRGYYSFEEFGSAHLSITASDQRGGKVTISAASIGPAGYGGGYKVEPRAGADTDSLAEGKRGKAVVKYRRRRVRDDYGKFQFVDTMEWSSSVKMKRGTRVVLGTSDSLDYGTFTFGAGRSTVTGGATRALADGKPRALLSGFQIASSGGTLHGDVTWSSESAGTVAFTAPPFLAGKSGTIRALPGGRFQVKGPKGIPCRITFDEDGKGSVDLGLGKFTVDGGDYGAFAITYE